MRIFPLLAAILIGGALVGCAQQAPPATDGPEPFTLSSPDRDADGYLPDWAVGSYRTFCDGENSSPTLEWSNAPDGVGGFVVTMTDPQFPSFIHWVVTGIDADATSLASAANGAVEDAAVGTGGAGAGSYVGPCVADNAYLYTVYALDEAVVGDSTTTIVDLTGLIEGHVLATAELEVKRR